MLHSLARRKDLFNLCKRAKLAYISSTVLYSMSCLYTVLRKRSFYPVFFTPWCAGWDLWVTCTLDHPGRRPIGPPTEPPRQKRTGNISMSIFKVFFRWFKLFFWNKARINIEGQTFFCSRNWFHPPPPFCQLRFSTQLEERRRERNGV